MKGLKFFIAGTDTDVGKTVVTTGLLVAAQARSLTTIGMKPVAAGCEATAEGLRNSDALAIAAAMTEDLPYAQINPIALEPAIAPHIAAKQLNKSLSADRIAGFCRGVLSINADIYLIEGAGGWRVPLSHRETLANVVQQLQLPVVLVVDLKLGCLNHALLTAEAVVRDGLRLAGWVGNHSQRRQMSSESDNIFTLGAMMPAPCLGIIPYIESPEPAKVAKFLDISPLLPKVV